MDIKNDKIDIVIPWVDGNDPIWIEEKNKYLKVNGDKSQNRFRDWGNLQYIFRGIEKFMPWINKVFFVTWGHLPKWINTNYEKLEIVNHRDYIPKEYLPTFNSNIIEMNLHRIKNLSEKFILFNDDIFIIKKIKKTYFFENDLPKDMYIEYLKLNCSKRHSIMKKNYQTIINKYFHKSEFIKANFNKVLNLKYGIDNLKNMRMITKSNFEDIYSEHLTQSFLKETFLEVWEKEGALLDEVCKNKFRSNSDIGVAICRYFQLLSGKFIPSKKKGKYFEISTNNELIISSIIKQKYKMICLNDSKTDIDFEKAKNEINSALNKLLNEKSKFEL